MKQAIVWSIAGSDCTGGAGIQADTKTIHNLGAKACSVITAVTAQNSQGVQEINAVDELTLYSQIASLEEEFPAAVIKIGMLANTQQVENVAKHIKRLKAKWAHQVRVVYDPVAVATSGDNLSEEDIVPAIKSHLLPLVDVLTPNNQEIQKLSGVYVFSWNCMQTAAQSLLDTGVGAVVLKGGHIDIEKDHCVDLCTDGYQSYWLSSPRYQTSQTHGTGCTMASAIAALMAQQYLLRDAFTLAKAYINQGLRNFQQHNPRDVWQGGFPCQPDDFPRVLVSGSELANTLDWSVDGESQFADDFSQTDTLRLGLYPVIDSLEWLERLLKLRVKTIQYREKHLKGEALDLAIAKAVALGRQYSARVFINDYWPLAIKHGAYGVHLGQEDLERADLVQIKGANLKLGISTHGHYELLKAREYRPSYLAVGAIFPTRTKNMTGQIQGVKTLSDLVKLSPDLPMVAIGGITHDNIQQVLDTGVGSVAVVTAITEAANPEIAVKNLKDVIDKHG